MKPSDIAKLRIYAFAIIAWCNGLGWGMAERFGLVVFFACATCACLGVALALWIHYGVSSEDGDWSKLDRDWERKQREEQDA